MWLEFAFLRKTKRVGVYSVKVAVAHKQNESLPSVAILYVCMDRHILHDIPYSAKFSRHLYFVDWPLKAISLHNVCGMTANRKPRLKSLHVIAGNLTIFVDLFSCRILTHEIREN